MASTTICGKILQAANARLACEAKKVNALPNPSSEHPAYSSAGNNTPIKPAPLGDKAPIKPKAHSQKPCVPSSVATRQHQIGRAHV